MFCLGGFWQGGFLSRGFLSGGLCPGGFCPRTCHLEQILICLELSRYQDLTVFTPGILDKGKFKESLYR